MDESDRIKRRWHVMEKPRTAESSEAKWVL